MPSLKEIQMAKTDRTVVKDERVSEYNNWEQHAEIRYLKASGKFDTSREDDDMIDILTRQGDTVPINVRLLAWVVDTVITAAPFGIGLFVSLLMGMSTAPPREMIIRALVSFDGFQGAPWPLQVGLPLTVVLIFINYFIIPVTHRNASFGQSILGIQIVSMSKNMPIGPLRNAARSFLYLTGPLIALGGVVWGAGTAVQSGGADALKNPIWLILTIFAGDLPYAIALFNEKKRCLHDFLTGTRLRFRNAIGEE